jgi:hypothetical protein
MINITSKHIKIQVKKDTLNDILLQKAFHVELNASKHWQKELINVELIDNNLTYTLKEIATITIANGLHTSLPSYKFECIRYFLNENQNKFIFQLGVKILDKQS